MRTRVWAWMWVVVIAGCRDLSLPTTDRLSVVLPFDSVAPRQKLTVTARGGSGSGYVFSFAPGGALSGPAASLTAEGEYQAGERGLAQDVLRVTDTAGNVADARIAVGAPLSLTPPIALIAPGGEVQFVASGGQPPYVFAQADGGLVTDGRFRADSAGDRFETITVTDATLDALAFARAQVSIGSGLVLYPPTSSLAPRERLAFVGLGGQPPYRFALREQGSAGTMNPSIDPLTGGYQAGSNDADGGTGVDVVIITDGNGLSAEARVTTGPALKAALPFTAQPGEPLVIAASGGKPPYVFDFAARGNRSNGSVDARTGAYVPGATPLAIDRLQLTDATGTTLALAPVSIGPLQLVTPWGRGGSQLLEADLDRDLETDLVSVNAGETFSLVNVIGATKSVVRSPAFSRQLFAMGTRVLGVGADVSLLQPVPGGGFLQRATAGLGPKGPGRAAWDGERFLYRTVNRPGTCVGVDRVDGFRFSAIDSTFADCLLTTPTASATFAVAVQGTSSESYVVTLPANAARDATTGPLEFHYFTPTLNAPVFTRTAQLPFPAGAVIRSTGDSALDGVGRLVDEPGQVGEDRLLVLLEALDGGPSKLWDVAGSQAAARSAPVDLVLPQPAIGLTATRGPPSLVAAWDGFSGKVLVHELQADGGIAQRQLVDVPSSVTAATFSDVNRDQVADLATTDVSSGAHVFLFGEGDGTFSRRPRFRVTNEQPAQLADLDADGSLDLIGYRDQHLQVFWGSSAEPSQLAAGPRLRLGGSPRSFLVAPTSGGAHEVFFTDSRGGAFTLTVDAQGIFSAPQPITSTGAVIENAVLTLVSVADLGGTAPGADVLAYKVSGEVFALLRDGAGAGRLVPVTIPGQCLVVPMQLDGQGPEELWFPCLGPTPNTTAVFVSRLQGGAFTAPTPIAGSPLAGSFRGHGRAADGTSWMQTGTQVHRLSGQGGQLVLDTSTSANTEALQAIARLDPSATRPQFLGLSNEQPTAIVVRGWNGTQWVDRQRIRVGDRCTITVLRRGPGKPDDLLVQAANGDVFVLVNDGTGTLR